MRGVAIGALLFAGCFPALEIQDCYTLGDCPPQRGACRVDPAPVRVAPAVEPAKPAMVWDGARFVVAWSEGLDLKSNSVAPDGSVDRPGDSLVLDTWEGFVDAPQPSLVRMGDRVHAAWQRSGATQVVWGPLGGASTVLVTGTELGGPALAAAGDRLAAAWWDIEGKGGLVVGAQATLELDLAPGLWGVPALIAQGDQTLHMSMATPGDTTNELALWTVTLNLQDPTRAVSPSPRTLETPGNPYRSALAWMGLEPAAAIEDGDDVRLAVGPELSVSAPRNAAGSRAKSPGLAWAADIQALGLAWAEGPDVAQRIRFALLDKAGAPLGETLDVSTEGNALAPQVAWSGSTWGVAWYDWVGPNAGDRKSVV